MDGGTISASAVSSVFVATLRISQVIYELKAVGEQTRDLLDSTTHVETSLQAVRTLRRQKSSHLDVTEKRWIDDVLINTEKTLGNVAALIEPARVDMQTKFGRVGFLNRGLFVFRDSPKVGTNLSRLSLASQSLNTAMNILCMREGHGTIGLSEKNMLHRPNIPQATSNGAQPPPTYIESEFLNRRRNTHLSTKPVTRCSSTTTLGAVKEKEAAETVCNPPLEDEVVAEPPMVTVQEVIPTPFQGLQNSPLDEADGLQVCEESHPETAIRKTINVAEGSHTRGAEYVTSPTVLSFEGADGLEVCDGKNQSIPPAQHKQFDEPDGLQVCNGWNAPIPVHQDPPVEMSQIQLAQDQQRQSNQWHEQRSSYQQPPYPIWEEERLHAGNWHDPHLQSQRWQHPPVGDHHRHISQPQNPPYPNITYQNISNQFPSFHDPTRQTSQYRDPPYLNTNSSLYQQPAYQQAPYPYDSNQDQRGKQLPPVPHGPLASSDEPLRRASVSSYVTNGRPSSPDTSTTIARKPVPKPPDTPQLTESPSSTSSSPVPRRTSQASTVSWTPSEVSQVSSTSTRKSRGRAWLEFQAER